MRLVEFTRVLPKTIAPVAVNPDYVVWVMGSTTYTVLFMEAGEPIDVEQGYADVVKALAGGD